MAAEEVKGKGRGGKGKASGGGRGQFGGNDQSADAEGKSGKGKGKGEGGKLAGGKVGGGKAADWTCPSCGDSVFGSRDACRQCNTTRDGSVKPADAEGKSGGKGKGGKGKGKGEGKYGAGKFGGGEDTGVKPGDWTCPECGDNCFASRDTCRKCFAQKPAGAGGEGGEGKASKEKKNDKHQAKACEPHHELSENISSMRFMMTGRDMLARELQEKDVLAHINELQWVVPGFEAEITKDEEELAAAALVTVTAAAGVPRLFRRSYKGFNPVVELAMQATLKKHAQLVEDAKELEDAAALQAMKKARKK